MTTAFVLSGGGNLGAVQAGMLAALLDHDLRPDVLVGTSVGALNAAFMAADVSPSRAEMLAHVWRGITRRDVFPASWRSALRVARGHTNSLVDPSPLRRILERFIDYPTIESAPSRLAIIATDLMNGSEVVLTRGSVIDAVMASAAIPAVFPPVELDGHVLVDGGVVNNTAISVAGRLGADVIYVLPAGYACALSEPPATALAMALHAVSLAIQRRLLEDVPAWQERVSLHVVPPLCPVSVPPTDFTQSAQLIERARDSTSRWLSRPLPPDQRDYLALHEHH